MYLSLGCLRLGLALAHLVDCIRPLVEIHVPIGIALAVPWLALLICGSPLQVSIPSQSLVGSLLECIDSIGVILVCRRLLPTS